MRKIILFLLLAGITFSASKAQPEDPGIDQVKQNVQSLRFDVQKLKTSSSGLNNEIEELKKVFQQQTAEMHAKIDRLEKSNSEALEATAGRIEKEINRARQDVKNLDKSQRSNTIYWVLSVSIVFLFSFILFIILKNQSENRRVELENEIKQKWDDLHNQQIELEEQIIKLIDSQALELNDIELIKETLRSSPQVPEGADHSLALKIADEIVEINKKSIAPIEGDSQASIMKIKDDFEAKGYEFIEMLNKPYEPGMKVLANFKVDTNLKPGERLITRVIKPQVNFKGKMIQPAQVEVSQGEEDENHR